MSNNNEYYRINAINDAIDLVAEFDIDRCIRTNYRFCEAIDDRQSGKREAMRELHAESDYDPCLDKILDLSMGLHGCRQLLSALYFLKGDRFHSDLWQQKHLLGADRVLNKRTELNDGEAD